MNEIIARAVNDDINLLDGQWHQIIIVVAGGRVTFIVDGETSGVR